jgi:predicted DNA-binding protein YlxM (UPF0122 family)
MGFRDRIINEEEVNKSVDSILEQKTGAEIAKELGISRQAVSQALKRSMEKMYKNVRKMDPSWGPFETAVVMSQILKVEEPDLSKFIKLLPPKIRKEVEEDAKKRLPRR